MAMSIFGVSHLEFEKLFGLIVVNVESLLDCYVWSFHLFIYFQVRA